MGDFDAQATVLQVFHFYDCLWERNLSLGVDDRESVVVSHQNQLSVIRFLDWSGVGDLNAGRARKDLDLLGGSCESIVDSAFERDKKFYQEIEGDKYPNTRIKLQGACWSLSVES